MRRDEWLVVIPSLMRQRQSFSDLLERVVDYGLQGSEPPAPDAQDDVDDAE